MAHRHQDTEQVANLTEPELFVVWAARSWVTAFKNRRAICPTVRMGFRLAGVDGGLQAVDRLFGVMAASTRRDLDFRCVNCPGLGGDEALLLRCMAGLQYGDELTTQAVLEDWLPQPEISAARLHAYDFASALTAASMLIPMQRLRYVGPFAGVDAVEGRCSIH